MKTHKESKKKRYPKSGYSVASVSDIGGESLKNQSIRFNTKKSNQSRSGMNMSQAYGGSKKSLSQFSGSMPNEEDYEEMKKEDDMFAGMDWVAGVLLIQDKLFDMEESARIRRPMSGDILSEKEWENYKRQVLYPLDLITIKSKVYNGEYEDLADYNKDMKQLFKNFKIFYTSMRTKEYENVVTTEYEYKKLFDELRESLQESGKIKIYFGHLRF